MTWAKGTGVEEGADEWRVLGFRGLEGRWARGLGVVVAKGLAVGCEAGATLA